MKRSAALQPLSREHHAALKLAKACERASVSGVRLDETRLRVLDAFVTELEPHFRTEERELLPVAPGDLAERTLSDHVRLRELAANLQRHSDAEALRGFGDCLMAHVRFEERELFPAIEAMLK